jgi:hypothetical protein
MFTPLDLATLLAVRQKQQVIAPFWLNFFGRTLAFETPYIDFEEVNRRYKKLAPFVAPNVQGRVITTQGSRMQRFSPAYVKPKSVIDPTKVIVRQVGETMYQPMSNAQRRLAVIAEEVKEQKTRIANREEWLAAHAIINGRVTIAGEDYPTKEVDFGRDPSLTYTLTGGARWSQNTGAPLTNILAARRNVNKLSGLVANRLIFGVDAWDLFVERLGLNNPTTGSLLDRNFRGSDTDITRMLNGYEGAELAGRFTGSNGASFECWVYNGSYEDDDGNEQPFLNSYDVVGVGAVDGVRCYGAIMDGHAGYKALPVFMKNWEENDPYVEYILSQSSPLMVPGEPNATFRIRVN